MKKKELIKRLALGALILAGIALLVIIAQFPYRAIKWKDHQTNLNYHIESVKEEAQEYASGIAEEIQQIPPDPALLSRVESEFLGRTGIKRYLWMMDSGGGFVFGVPSTVFTYINDYYDEYRDVIEADRSYIGQNDFLSKLIDKHAEINFEHFEVSGETEKIPKTWRFYDPARRLKRNWTDSDRYSGNYYTTPRTQLVSSPVKDDQGNLLGNVYMKVDDSANESMYLSRRFLEYRDIFRNYLLEPAQIILGLSVVFLWFLLPTWVYIDTRQRGIRNPLLWVILTLLSGPFGWLVYLITRPAEPESMNCPQCANELNGTRAFCPYCGFDLSNTFCPECQYPVKPDYVFCPSCRTELKKSTEKPKNRRKKKDSDEFLLADNE
jgi:hypothetical protein